MNSPVRSESVEKQKNEFLLFYFLANPCFFNTMHSFNSIIPIFIQIEKEDLGYDQLQRIAKFHAVLNMWQRNCISENKKS